MFLKKCYLSLIYDIIVYISFIVNTYRKYISLFLLSLFLLSDIMNLSYKKEGVNMSMSEKIRIALVKRKISVTELANSLNTSQSNLSNKLKRDNFSEKELNQIADILNCDFKGIFVMRDTKEEI